VRWIRPRVAFKAAHTYKTLPPDITQTLTLKEQPRIPKYAVVYYQARKFIRFSGCRRAGVRRNPREDRTRPTLGCTHRLPARLVWKPAARKQSCCNSPHMLVALHSTGHEAHATSSSEQSVWWMSTPPSPLVQGQPTRQYKCTPNSICKQ
jgi:hypothetical protein